MSDWSLKQAETCVKPFIRCHRQLQRKFIPIFNAETRVWRTFFLTFDAKTRIWLAFPVTFNSQWTVWRTFPVAFNSYWTPWCTFPTTSILLNLQKRTSRPYQWQNHTENVRQQAKIVSIPHIFEHLTEVLWEKVTVFALFLLYLRANCGTGIRSQTIVQT